MNNKIIKSNITEELKEKFNDICLRELGLGVNDNNLVYDINTLSILQINEKFLKYCDEDNCTLSPNEMELNLLENSKILSILFNKYIQEYSASTGNYVHSYSQSTTVKGMPGFMTCNFIINGRIERMDSDQFINESTRILNLICKLNKSTMIYDFNMFNIL